ncbi:hypothetical protein FQP90_02300 [Paenarthrobacter nitroguajacolicus]|uniref:Uncharacterized protein n=1 Tax=Paenarthrobacter nitroguajacolicus TaxID=211146 RepID=A0A558HAS1_PAENT|nr:hypothetical protein [Paenarthrobacter nitroguajacolicus]TVU66230.1 hypothetical protein FQP90_02300 [Paenarthrobacter nitroguajacolicus]
MEHAVDTFDVDGRITVRSGDGIFFRVPGGSTPGTNGGAADRIRAELLERRLAGQRPAAGRERVSVAGPGAGRVVGALEAAGVLATPWDDAQDPAVPGLLIHLPSSPAERTRFDHLPAAGTAVLRCYAEGELVFLDPLALSPRDPSSTQILRRRLAASAAAAELKAWLQTPAAATELSLPDTAWSMVIARVLGTVKAWQSESAALQPLRRTLWRLDTRTLAASEHPVLPFPEPALLAGGLPLPRR